MLIFPLSCAHLFISLHWLFFMLHYACILLFIHFIHFEFQFSILSFSFSRFFSVCLCSAVLFSLVHFALVHFPLSLVCLLPLFHNIQIQWPKQTESDAVLLSRGIVAAREGAAKGEVTGVWGDKCNEGWWPRDSGASCKSDGLASKPAFVGSIAFNWSPWRIRYTISVCWVFWND